MNLIPQAILILGFTLTASPCVAGNVVDYYKQMQEQEGEDDFPYTLRKEAGQWDAEGGEDTPAVDAVVDEKNGYIRITELSGIGGTRTETQFVLFRGQENTPVLVWVTSLFKGVQSQPIESTARAYGNDGDEWFDLGEGHSGFPRLAFSDFLPDTMSVADANALAKLSSDYYASIYYKMPRHGTKTEAWLSIRDSENAPLCDGSYAGKQNAAAIKHYCTKLKGRIYYKADIGWNKHQTRFEIGEKYEGLPDWDSIW